jgi:hypothetical protein
MGCGVQKTFAPAGRSKCGEQIIGSLSDNTFKNYTQTKVQLSSILESMKLLSQTISRTGSQWIS